MQAHRFFEWAAAPHIPCLAVQHSLLSNLPLGMPLLLPLSSSYPTALTQDIYADKCKLKKFSAPSSTPSRTTISTAAQAPAATDSAQLGGNRGWGPGWAWTLGSAAQRRLLLSHWAGSDTGRAGGGVEQQPGTEDSVGSMDSSDGRDNIGSEGSRDSVGRSASWAGLGELQVARDGGEQERRT